MSGIAGIFHFDGRPAEPEAARRMLRAIAHRGPDGSGCWSEGPVAIGHLMLRTTPESLFEKQPFSDGEFKLCLTFDGRVDNRQELQSALTALGARLWTETDAELVLRAYQYWGEDCPQRIIGDFAFAIWDGRQQKLFCARDPLGMKPFYYYTDGRRFLWASEPRAFFEDPTVPKEPNEGMIGELLASYITSKEETVYRGILRLPAGHLLVASQGQVRKRRYWVPDVRREIRYATDREYAEHFRELFRDAVRCRLRCHGRVGSYLSGGLDSSSVVGMSRWLCRNGEVPDSGFETFSVVFPGSLLDESTYISAVARMWNLAVNTITPKEVDFAGCRHQIRRHQDLPHYPSGVMFEPLLAQARNKGFRVILTGYGGDEWFTGNRYHYADLARSFRLVSLFRELQAERTILKAYGALNLPAPLPILRYAAWPLVPHSAQRLVRLALGHTRVPPWIDPVFARRNNLADRLDSDRGGAIGFPSLAQEAMFAVSTGAPQAHALELDERSTASFGVEPRMPLHDRRIVEFGLALPEVQRWRGTQRKYVLRLAMEDLLPETVRQRLTKGEFSCTFVSAMEALGGASLFEATAAERHGWVDGSSFVAMYRRMMKLYEQGDPGYTSFVYALWEFVSIDLWLKNVYGESRSAPVPLSPGGWEPTAATVHLRGESQ